MEACSGKVRDFTSIAWYYVPGVDFFTVGADSKIAGYWQPYHHSITLAGNRVNQASVVRHEQLHAILNTTQHPPEFFDDKCASLVKIDVNGESRICVRGYRRNAFFSRVIRARRVALVDVESRE